MRIRPTASLLGFLILAFTSNANATLMSIEALYNAPGVGNGTASVTGIYDDTGFTGVGQEIFNFTGVVQISFSANGGSFLAGTSHTVNDMFGIAFVDGTPVDLINHNNTDPATGKSLLIFNSLASVGYGIYMADSGADMDVEGWWVVNHQAPQGHTLAGFVGPNPVVVPEPSTLVLISLGLLRLSYIRRG